MKPTRTSSPISRWTALLVTIGGLALVAAVLIPLWQNLGGGCRGRPGVVEIVEIYKACAARLYSGGGLPTAVEPRPDSDLPPDESRSREVIRTLVQPGRNGTPWLDHLDVDKDGTYLDPWGRQYLIIFDDNGDGIFPYGPGVRLDPNRPVLVVSRGPNRRLDGPGGDDVLPARLQVVPIR